MTLTANAQPRTRWLASLLRAEPGEIPALLLSCGFFFCVLCGYYVVRPIRDETGVAYGTGFLGWAFVIIFVVMLAAVPLIGWLVANLPRARVIPIVYGFFIASVLVFWALLRFELSSVHVATAFYVWVSVFVLFVVSLFWSFMTEVWQPQQSKRVYGVISAGGTLGALTGPLLVQALIHPIGVANLLLLTGFFLSMALVFYSALRRLVIASASAPAAKPDGASVFAGALNVWKSPYLFRIALWMLAGNFFGLYFTQEQARIYGAALFDQDARIILLSRVENAVSLLTLTLEVLISGRLMRGIGVGRTLALGPLVVSFALIALALSPSVAVISTIMVMSRALDYGLSGPTMRVLYTIIDPADKYRAQNFNDTVVYRGGNVASTLVYNAVAKAFGAAAPIITIFAVPAGLAWVWLSLDLGVRHERAAPLKPEPPK